MPNNSYADCLRHWGDLTAAIAANPDLTFLDPQRILLETELEDLRDLSVRQASLRRQTQETSLDLADAVKRGRTMATRLHDSIRGFYGRTGERLVEYRLQPRRSRSKPAPDPEPPPPPPEPDKPPGLGSTPARTAAPVTDGST